MLLILCGKSGSGKDTIAQAMCESEGIQRLVSCTDRPARDGEKNGREYYFYSKEEMAEKISSGQMIEYRSYDTLVDGKPDVWTYGTEKFTRNPDVPAERENIAVAIKDLDGAAAIKNYCESIGEPCMTVLITCPDNIRQKRAEERGSFSLTEWNRRLSADAVDFSEDKVRAVIDYEVANNGDFLPGGIANHILRMTRAEMNRDSAELFEEIER